MKQPQQMGSMADFSAFLLVKQAQQSGERFPVYLFSKHTNVSRLFKIKTGLELVVTHFFLSFHRLGYPKRQESKLSNSLRLNSFEHAK